MQHGSAMIWLTVQVGRLAVAAFFLVFAISGAAMAAGSHAHAHQSGDGVPAQAAKAQALTQALVALNGRYLALGADGGADLERPPCRIG